METERKDEKAPRAVQAMPSKAGKKESKKKQDDGWGGQGHVSVHTLYNSFIRLCLFSL